MESELQQSPVVAVIEADDSVSRGIARAILSAGFPEEVFTSVEQFIRSNQTPRCLVIDVQLPGMSGLQLQSHLASAGRHIPIIFINACMDEKSRALAFELGAVNIRDNASGHKALLKEITWRLKPRDGGRSTESGQSEKAEASIRDEKL